MGIGVTSLRLCRVCGAGHEGPDDCRGGLPATGAEVHGRSVQVETAVGREAIRVLLAPSHDAWRARIVTLPNRLWTVPGSRETIKFLGATRQDAEAQALLFVEQHIKAQRREAGEAAAKAGLARSTPGAPARAAFAAARRKLLRMPVRYGCDHAVNRGVTVNMSAEGMFVGVMAPDIVGQSLIIHLDVNGHTLAMHGLVLWSRRRAEPNRPAGMGIRLMDPPTLYHSFVAGLP